MARARSQPWRTSSSSVTTATSEAGIVNPPAPVIPSPAPGSRQAATRASSRPGRIARQSGSRWSADACGAPVGSFRAEAAQALAEPHEVVEQGGDGALDAGGRGVEGGVGHAVEQRGDPAGGRFEVGNGHVVLTVAVAGTHRRAE